MRMSRNLSIQLFYNQLNLSVLRRTAQTKMNKENANQNGDAKDESTSQAQTTGSGQESSSSGETKDTNGEGTEKDEEETGAEGGSEETGTT
jgi:hypothetical protein